ncbi:MAG: OsmC family protein [Anaerolineales bacterium]|nr:OsmC family protein [Anaerolineales bacterium]
MKAEVQWKGKLSFSGTADSGFEIPLGSYPEVGGDNDGFRPMELMAISLAGCTAMDVISILIKKRQEVSDFQVKVYAERAEAHPKVFTQAVIEYHVVGKEISEKAITRAMELSADVYCPAQAMMGKVIPLELKYYIYEGENLDSAAFVTEGKIR